MRNTRSGIQLDTVEPDAEHQILCIRSGHKVPLIFSNPSPSRVERACRNDMSVRLGTEIILGEKAFIVRDRQCGWALPWH